MTLTDQEISLIQELLKIQDAEHVELITHLKPYVPQYWALADDSAKDDPEVRENFDRLNSVRDALRGLRKNRKMFASINTKLKQNRKENQRGGENPWIINNQTTDVAPLHAKIQVVYSSGVSDGGWSNDWNWSWNTTRECHITKYRIVK